MRPRTYAALFALALALRLLFVAWASVLPSGDAFFYEMHGRFLAAGAGYVNHDGSPGIWWVPGWPLVIAGLYRVFGVEPDVVAWANVLFGAATVPLVASLGARWLGARVGAIAGLLYAVWPGLIYYTATLYTEPFFCFLLAATLRALVAAGDRATGRGLAFAGAGLLFGALSLVKAEPLAFLPAVLLFLWTVRRSPRDFVRAAAAVGVATACVLAPWVVRNHLRFDRWIVTSASGGLMAYLGHHPGSGGSNDFRASSDFLDRHMRDTFAEACLAQNEAGWREAAQFALDHPGEELRIQGRKLLASYGGDDEGAKLVRGVRGRRHWTLTPPVYRRLRVVANTFWLALLALAAVGLTTLHRWPPPARALLLGLALTWMGLHVVFVGGTRYRVPESLAHAVLAACGVERVGDAVRRWRASG